MVVGTQKILFAFPAIALATACASPALTDASDGGLATDAEEVDGCAADGGLVGHDAMPWDAVSYGEMVYVAEGPFWMGCHDRKLDWCTRRGMPGFRDCCGTFEGPAHEVHTRAFFIDRTEVTYGALRACVAAGACWSARIVLDDLRCGKAALERSEVPASCASPELAAAFCSWSDKRLCSEAEWEKAARGGCEHNLPDCATSTRYFPWGDAPGTCNEAIQFEWSDSASISPHGCGHGVPWPVGSRPAGASPYGALDMAGNVWEYVADCWHDTFDGAPTDGSAWLDSCESSGLVVRGGSFESSFVSANAKRRTNLAPGETCCGFRCCKDAE